MEVVNLKKIIILLILLMVSTGCDYIVIEDNENNKTNDVNENIVEEQKEESKQEVKKIDISSEKYLTLIEEVLNESTKNSELLSYSGYTLYLPYIQVSIIPNKKCDNNLLLAEAKKITSYILENLKNNKYKKGSIFKSNYEYINIYFYNYDEFGRLSRNEGPFVQIEILDIHNLKIDDIIK